MTNTQTDTPTNGHY